jgi:hypothetical protein
MQTIPCGDCGEPLARGAKGCPVCGRNIAGERRVLAWLVGFAVVAAALLGAGVLAVVWK